MMKPLPVFFTWRPLPSSLYSSSIHSTDTPIGHPEVAVLAQSHSVILASHLRYHRFQSLSSSPKPVISIGADTTWIFMRKAALTPKSQPDTSLNLYPVSHFQDWRCSFFVMFLVALQNPLARPGYSDPDSNYSYSQVPLFPTVSPTLSPLSEQ